ncbi:GNAT family N-acetyltransferase [Subsaximicrobium wynnwilliamsii]|uniref:GNAT family N-acetyltransferase n=1 Tax=Subsaximicrobium wynnwilliamsii TaxID=291179 RepID=A0A5C6ZE87_9FLAO|nr:GNAT family N-acetyltransferase [Subsaximicrobium wynnwilliamsii]TXD81685.1 GNAT family N-acetyltransferase [Subsaximicrobium wynnwilliamsii]TXD87440.1 GNAT family N-acetyltransferase [Subsaximicrobium wynnwilliamsii]TXE01128.1 GNAT family N-acetyltransferase [Subsaximicrobium wynnwilliamsii]
MDFFFTKDKEWLDKWDAYVAVNPRASHLILSDWLKSYLSYGFDYEVGIALEDDIIIGGFGVVIPKVLFFKFYIIPHGPIVTRGYEANLETILGQIRARAKWLNCCYVQVSLPISNNFKIKNHVYSSAEVQNTYHKFKRGKLFDYVYCSYGLNWVDFSNYLKPDDYLESLSPKVRRNIRLPYRKNTQVTYANHIAEIKNGYALIEDNAKEAGYDIRSFDDLKDVILNLIKGHQAFFINIYVDGVIKASAFFIIAAGHLTNIMGGVTKEKPDIKLGYMLQWEAVKRSFELGFIGYNISMGGSQGVKDFKARFGTEAITYENPHFYSVIRPAVFGIFITIEKYIKPYKRKISSLLSKLQ